MKNVDQIAEEKRWERIYARGAETAKKFKITSEADIDRILLETCELLKTAKVVELK